MSRDGLPREVAEVFAASESLYRATLAEIAANRPLPDAAESASHIAFSVAMLALKWRVQCPEWARHCVLCAWASFENFEAASVGEAFGIPDTKQAHAKHTARLCAAVYYHVRALEAQGYPQKDNAKRKGSLSIVGDKFHMSAAQVKRQMATWRSLCKKLERNPDDRPRHADPQSLIAQTIAHAFYTRAKKSSKV